MLWDLKKMQCNLKEMVDIVEIVQAVVMVDIVDIDIVDIDIVDIDIVDIVVSLDIAGIVDTVCICCKQFGTILGSNWNNLKNLTPPPTHSPFYLFIY